MCALPHGRGGSSAVGACARWPKATAATIAGYHVGTFWPFDSSIIAWGLTRYCYRTEAARIAEGDTVRRAVLP